MASNTYRVNKEIILHIAEHCDLQTLSAVMRTCKDVHNLVANFEHSISKAKIADSYQPPQDLVLNSEDEQRFIILERNTFATVRELELRRCRIDSILNRCGFLLTGDPKILGFNSESLDKFKAGLRDAIYLADRTADLATMYPTRSYIKQAPKPAYSAIGQLSNDSWADSMAKRSRLQMALRRTQVAYLRSQTSRDLAWLLTLAAGGSKGYARYSARLLESDPAMADARIMAFKEVLLRYGGSMVLWGFMRDSKTLGPFVRQAVGRCAEEVVFFELNAQPLALEEEAKDDDEDEELPGGLHMSIMAELNQRMVAQKRARAAKEGELFDGEVHAREVWHAIDKLVGKEIGSETWGGYAAVMYPG